MLNTPPAPWTLHIVDNCWTLHIIEHCWILHIIEHCWTLNTVEHCTCWTLHTLNIVQHCWTLHMSNTPQAPWITRCPNVPMHTKSKTDTSSEVKKIFGVIIQQKQCSFFFSFPFLLWVHINNTDISKLNLQNMTAQNQIFQPWQRNKSCLNINDIFRHYPPDMWMSNREKTTHGAGAECRELRANLHPVGWSLAGG